MQRERDLKKSRSLRKGKMPTDYRQKRREVKRREDIGLAVRLGMVSRHLEDPKGSEEWVRTGIWPENVAVDDDHTMPDPDEAEMRVGLEQDLEAEEVAEYVRRATFGGSGECLSADGC